MPTTPDVVVGHLFPWFLSTKARHFSSLLSLFFGSLLSLTEFLVSVVLSLGVRCICTGWQEQVAFLLDTDDEPSFFAA